MHFYAADYLAFSALLLSLPLSLFSLTSLPSLPPSLSCSRAHRVFCYTILSRAPGIIIRGTNRAGRPFRGYIYCVIICSYASPFIYGATSSTFPLCYFNECRTKERTNEPGNFGGGSSFRTKYEIVSAIEAPTARNLNNKRDDDLLRAEVPTFFSLHRKRGSGSKTLT